MGTPFSLFAQGEGRWGTIVKIDVSNLDASREVRR
jgi:hypothetical protein